jgi:hypothetical protein
MTTRADMSSKAVTLRLIRTSQLRRLCLELARAHRSSHASQTARPSGAGARDRVAGE